MSSGVKRTAAPPAPPQPGERGRGGGEAGPAMKKGTREGQEGGRSSSTTTTNGSASAPAPLTYYSGGDVAADYVSMKVTAEQVTLEVVPPSGAASSSVVVDFK
ncbi:hypothetical protein ACOMHN_054491 [Nucella lapillus]